MHFWNHEGQFRVIKTGIRLGRQEADNKMVVIYCALHSMLLEVNCLGRGYENGVSHIWEGKVDLHDENDHFPDATTRQLLTPFER
jgi:hypothetical protein